MYYYEACLLNALMLRVFNIKIKRT